MPDAVLSHLSPREAGVGDAAQAPELTNFSTDQLFEKAVLANSRRLLAIARSIVGNRASPEDIVQQALTNLYQHRERYDWREPGGLMRRSVVNEALRILRQPRMTVVADDMPGEAITPVRGIMDRETIAQVRAAIDQLPEHFRSALVLCEYENMAYAQIAETLGASVPQVKTWLHRARKQLAKILRPMMSGERTSSEKTGSEKTSGEKIGREKTAGEKKSVDKNDDLENEI